MGDRVAPLEIRRYCLGQLLPLVASPAAAGVSLLEALPALREIVSEQLHDVGGILFRGFNLAGVEDFEKFSGSLGGGLLDYEFGSTPRSRVASRVYTSTEYPAHQAIPLHNEQSYSRQWPMQIFFHCVTPSPRGGETPIADSREIYRRLDRDIVRRFSERGLSYVRNFGNGLDVPWTQVFDTQDRAVVESYCRAHDIAWEWKADGELRTRQRCQAVAQHPRTREWVWFNQAHLFHVSAVDPEVREVLFDAIGEEDLPRNVYYGDGSPLELGVLEEIRGVLAEVEVAFPWQAGDVLMLDNMLVAHARRPFSGERKVVVAMAEPYSERATASPGAAA